MARYAALPAATTSNWGDTSTWKATTGGATGASVPDNTQDVFINADSVAGAAAILSVNVAANCLSLDFTGATSSPQFKNAGQTFNVYGNVTFINAMSINKTGSDYLLTIQGNCNLTTNGLSLGTPGAGVGTINMPTAGKTLTIIDNTTCDLIAHQIGTLVISSGVTLNCGSMSGAYTNAKTHTFNNATINCTSFSANSLDTVTANTATINVSGTGAFVGGAVNYNGASINLIGSAHTVSGSWTTTGNLTFHPTSHTNANVLTMTSGSTVTVGSFVLVGNARSTQILVQSSTLGTAATITATNWTGSDNFDLMDITATNAVDFNALGFAVGNCGGNTGITFPAAIGTQAFTYGGVDYKTSTAGNWPTRIPLVGIDAYTVDTTGVTISWDMPRMGSTGTWTGTGTITPSVSRTIYGSLAIPTGATWTTGTNTMTFGGRGSFTFASGGKTFYNITNACPTGTLTLTANLTVSNIFAQTIGTFNDGGYSVTLSATSAITKWNATGGTVTSTGTITLTSSLTNAHTFAGGGLTYNNVQVAGAGNYALTVTGNNTFNVFTVDRSVAAKSLVATGTTQTVNNFICTTSSTRVVTITGGTWTKSGGGTIDLDYMTVKSSTATPASTWYAGAPPHSTNGFNNSGWIFGRVDSLRLIQGGTARRIGLSTDTKSTGLNPGSRFWESDTDKYYLTNDGTNWVPLRGRNYDSNFRNLYR